MFSAHVGHFEALIDSLESGLQHIKHPMEKKFIVGVDSPEGRSSSRYGPIMAPVDQGDRKCV
jgi:hypothetical protein